MGCGPFDVASNPAGPPCSPEFDGLKRSSGPAFCAAVRNRRKSFGVDKFEDSGHHESDQFPGFPSRISSTC